MMQARHVAAAMLAALFIGTETAAQSFWTDAKVSESSYIAVKPIPAKPFKKNDIITVVISETAKASGTGTLERSRDVEKDLIIDKWFRLAKSNGGNLTLRQALLDGGTETKPQWKGSYTDQDTRDGSIERQDKFETRVAAVVRDVKPNGNLIIEAETVTVLNGERRVITLTGMVRSEDVRPGNTIPSYCVAFAEIHYDTGGPATDGTRRGWLTKIFDLFNPF